MAGCQGRGSADEDELIVAPHSTHHSLRRLERANDGPDDHLGGLPVLDLDPVAFTWPVRGCFAFDHESFDAHGPQFLEPQHGLFEVTWLGVRCSGGVQS